MRKWEEIRAPKGAYSAILKREMPKLYWPADEVCPVDPGDEVEIYAGKLWLTIGGVKKAKKGNIYVASYSVTDLRGRYLARGNGYTSSPKESIDREASAVDRKVVDEWAKEAAERNLKRQEAKRKADPKAYERRVIDRIRATTKGLDEKGSLSLLEEIEQRLLDTGKRDTSAA